MTKLTTICITMVLAGCTTAAPPNPAARCADVCAAFTEPECAEHLGRDCLDGCLTTVEINAGCADELDVLLACQASSGCIDMALECRDARDRFVGCQNELAAL